MDPAPVTHDPRCIILRNLPLTLDDEGLYKLFEEYGEIEYVEVIVWIYLNCICLYYNIFVI